MPAYPGTGLAQILDQNRQTFLFNSETLVAVPVASIAVQLQRSYSPLYYPFGASFELTFSGNPGTFEVDVQTADTDMDSHYCTINTLNSLSALNATYTGRVELPQFWAKYVRAYVKSFANFATVSITFLVTR